MASITHTSPALKKAVFKLFKQGLSNEKIKERQHIQGRTLKRLRKEFNESESKGSDS